jgi:hypothetical protein
LLKRRRTWADSGGLLRFRATALSFAVAEPCAAPLVPYPITASTGTHSPFR